MQVALIAASCCAASIWSMVVVLVHVVAASCTDYLWCCSWPGNFCPDLCTLRFWCFTSFNWCKHSTCTGDGWHRLQLAWWCFLMQLLTQIVHWHTWWYLSATRACVFLSATGANAALALGLIALCNVALRWWLLYLYGGGGGGIYIRTLHWNLSNVHCVGVVWVGGRCLWKWRYSCSYMRQYCNDICTDGTGCFVLSIH